MKLQRECKLALRRGGLQAVILTMALSLVLGTNDIHDVSLSDILFLTCSVQ